MPEGLNFLLVEDHPLVRAGTVQLLQRLGPAVKVLEAETCEQAMCLCRENPDLDLVLLDLALPGMDGFEGLVHFRREFPGIPVVMLSAADQSDTIRQAMQLGAQGYLLKTMPPGVLEQALRLILEGSVYLPPTVLETLASSPLQRLTPRQREVLLLLEKGFSNKEIGRRLGLSENTVRAHAAAIFRILGVRNRTQAARMLRESGLVSGDSDTV